MTEEIKEPTVTTETKEKAPRKNDNKKEFF